MTNTQINTFIPDYLVTPGEVLEEYLEELNMTQAELSDRTGLAKKTINEIIKAKSPITPETALKLERVLDRPAHFWSNLERQYQDDQTRLAEQQRLENHLCWLDKMPVKAMIKLGWLPQIKDKTEQLKAVLSFFGIAAPEQWPIVWAKYQVAYRQTECFEKSFEAVSAWLRQGEIKARQIFCEPYDRKNFLTTLDDIRLLTKKGPKEFVPILIEKCALSGVAVVFVPELPKVGVWGATRWFGDKALIQLSLRYKSNDHLWFTFFHEAAHILLHNRKDIFIEDSQLGCKKEEEANEFARKKLIPPAQMRRLLKSGKPTLAKIKDFADKIGIAPGIVVGRLQHDKVLPRNEGSKLKVFYTWEDMQGQ